LVSVSPTTSGFYRVLIGGGTLALYLLFTRRRLELSRTTITVLLSAAIFFALDLWFWHRSINYIGPGLATLLAGMLFLHQRPRRNQVIAIPLAGVGLALIVGLAAAGYGCRSRGGISRHPHACRCGLANQLRHSVPLQWHTGNHLLTLNQTRRPNHC